MDSLRSVLLMPQSLFNLPYFKVGLSNWPMLKSEFESLLKENPMEVYKGQNFYSNRRTRASTFIDGVISIVKPIIDKECEFLHSYKITDAWGACYKTGQDQILHSHKAAWVGIIYVNFNPDEHGVTLYKRPYNDFVTGLVHYEMIPVKEGEVVLVPGLVEHLAPTNKSKDKRTTIGFDMNLDLHPKELHG